jgi:hypothetical protein
VESILAWYLSRRIDARRQRAGRRLQRQSAAGGSGAAHGHGGAQAAGAIHTDFERGFIRAEVIAYDDFVRCQGEAGAREAGKLRLAGKENFVREGDVMHFRFNG